MNLIRKRLKNIPYDWWIRSVYKLYFNTVGIIWDNGKVDGQVYLDGCGIITMCMI